MVGNLIIGKYSAICVILLFVGAFTFPVTAQDIEKICQSTSEGEWLYVGGSGPGNYSKIQDALDNATDGDTIFVYSGSYYEDIIVEKRVTLQGQDKNTTSIEGAGDEDNTITICSDGVRISRFTLKNEAPYVTDSVIVFAQTNFSYIMGNSFVGDDSIEALFSSIYMVGSKHNVISGNTFSKGIIRLHFGCNYNEISYNTLDVTICGIFLFFSYYNTLNNNVINGAQQAAIVISYSNNNNLSYNTITNSFCAITLSGEDCEITYNNFISVKIKAKIYSNDNLWNHNYWGAPRFLPRLIIWLDYVNSHPPDPPRLVFYFAIDWHPAWAPNEIIMILF